MIVTLFSPHNLPSIVLPSGPSEWLTWLAILGLAGYCYLIFCEDKLLKNLFLAGE